MRMTEQVATLRLGRQVRKAEQSLDLALAESALLLSESARARAETEQAAATGQDAILSLAKIVRGLTSLQSDMRHAHRSMRNIATEKGFAPEHPEDCPDTFVGAELNGEEQAA